MGTPDIFLSDDLDQVLKKEGGAFKVPFELIDEGRIDGPLLGIALVVLCPHNEVIVNGKLEGLELEKDKLRQISNM